MPRLIQESQQHGKSPCLQGLFFAFAKATGPIRRQVQGRVNPPSNQNVPMKTASQPAFRSLLVILAFVLVSALAYFPGLTGGFIYDDWGSIAGNPSVQIKDGTWMEWSKSAISFPSGTPPFRSLAMMSFAANHLFGGLDPYPYKATNLAIHLLNGLLLFLALRKLFELRSACAAGAAQTATFEVGLAAAAVAGLWLVLPINLTAVLYVVQRLESLSTTFIFLGLWWYLSARLRHWRGESNGYGLWISLGVCTVLGILCKEVGVMLPLYAGLIELCLTGGRNRDGRLSRPVLALYLVTLALPMVVGGFWVWNRYIGTKVFDPDSYTVLRLLTESRIIVSYMQWTLVPTLDALTLHHDDIVLSSGLFTPITTVISVIALAILLCAALWQRRRRPLFALGVLWFFAGHLLTGTFIPLILAFEHRNYFSSAGLLLAVASLASLEGGISRSRFRIAAVVVVALFYSGTLWMRAQEWSDPLRQATSDAMKRPRSPAAQFDYAQALIDSGRSSGRPEPVTAALKVLDYARQLPGASIHFEQTMIGILAPSGYVVPEPVWASLIDKLRTRKADTNAIHSLAKLNHCFMSKKCKAEDLPKLAQAYDAAFSHPSPNIGLLGVHGEYAWHVINDREAAERDYREAFRRQPHDIEAEMNLIVVLIHEDKLDEAESMIRSIESRNYMGSLDAYVIPLKATLAAYKARKGQAADTP